MSAINPYAPPGAVVDDVVLTAEVQPMRVFSAAGRMGRLRLLAYMGASYLCMLIVFFAFGLLAALAHINLMGLGVQTLVIVVASVITIMWNVQRSHDMNWSGWSVLLMFIPFVAFIWFLKPGTAGINRFGSPPPPNTTGVKVLAWVFPLMFVAGILAAIALPAYQTYTHRAIAARSGVV